MEIQIQDLGFEGQEGFRQEISQGKNKNKSMEEYISIEWIVVYELVNLNKMKGV